MPLPAQKPISLEYRYYLAFWRKAVLQPEMVVVRARNFNMAVAMRQGMYRAIRPFRFGQVIDEQLKTAAEKFVVYLVKADDPKDIHFLELRKRLTLEFLESDFDFLGIDEEDLLFGDERTSALKVKKLLNEQEAPQPVRATPFYQRED